MKKKSGPVLFFAAALVGILQLGCSGVRPSPCRPGTVRLLEVNHYSGGIAPLAATLTLGVEGDLTYRNPRGKTRCARVEPAVVEAVQGHLANPALATAAREAALRSQDWDDREEILVQGGAIDATMGIAEVPPELSGLFSLLSHLVTDLMGQRVTWDNPNDSYFSALPELE
jgi:hypothetical protein